MPEIVVTRGSQGKTIDAHLGDVIVFQLEENLTTGYSWQVECGDGAVIALGESTYLESNGMAMGRGGMRLVHFIALSPGNQEVRLHLRRPWDSTDKSNEQFSVTIRVH